VAKKAKRTKTLSLDTHPALLATREIEEINKYSYSTSGVVDVSGLRRSNRDYERSPGKIFTNQVNSTKNQESHTL